MTPKALWVMRLTSVFIDSTRPLEGAGLDCGEDRGLVLDNAPSESHERGYAGSVRPADPFAERFTGGHFVRPCFVKKGSWLSNPSVVHAGHIAILSF